MREVKIFSLQSSTDLEIVGDYPQLEPIKKYFEVKNNYKLLNWSSFPDFEPNLDTFEFKPKAKITDFISGYDISLNVGDFISLKLASLFNNDCGNYKLYSAKVEKSKTAEVECKFLHVIDIPHHEIDFENTIFINFINKEELSYSQIELKKPIPFTRFKKLVLKREFEIMRLMGKSELYVTEDFKEKIEANNITGVEFKQYDETEVFFV